MSELNADIPHFYCFLRREYLYDLKRGHGETVPCVVFAVCSIPSRALMFHCLLEDGSQIARLPISAFVHKQDAPVLDLEVLELWNNFSYQLAVNRYEFLRGLKVRTILKDRRWYDGEYMFTVDWFGSEYSEDPGEGGFKQGHVLRLENGCYAVQPNNRIQWFEPSFITRPFQEKPDYLTNSHVWSAETRSKWMTDDSQRMFYGTEDP